MNLFQLINNLFIAFILPYDIIIYILKNFIPCNIYNYITRIKNNTHLFNLLFTKFLQNMLYCVWFIILLCIKGFNFELTKFELIIGILFLTILIMIINKYNKYLFI